MLGARAPLDRCAAVPCRRSAWGRVRVKSEVDREPEHTMPVTTLRRLEATASQVAGQFWRDDSRVDESPRRVERHDRADDRSVCRARVHREDATATVRGARRSKHQRHARWLGAGSGQRFRFRVDRGRRAGQERDRHYQAGQHRPEDPVHADDPRACTSRTRSHLQRKRGQVASLFFGSDQGKGGGQHDPCRHEVHIVRDLP
jgi:hypothetical protein